MNLHKQNYLNRLFDISYKLANKPAIFSLSYDGARYLKAHSKLNQKAIHNIYFSKRLSKAYIEHCLSTYDVSLAFKHWYGNELTFFSKSELYGFDIFPKQLPDGYLILNRPGKANKEYLLEIFDSSLPSFSITNKVRGYKKHHQQDIWAGDYPILLFICETPSIERQVQQTANKSFANIENVEIYTTSLKALLEAQNKSDAIWSGVRSPNTLLSF